MTGRARCTGTTAAGNQCTLPARPDTDPPRCAHHLDISEHPKKRAFLDEYARHGIVTRAAEAAGISRGAHYLWMGDDPDYPAAFADAHARACDAIRGEIFRRGVEGWDEPVFHEGQVVGFKRRYSDVQLTNLAKSRMPEEFREKVDHRVTGELRNPQADAMLAALIGDRSKLDDAVRLLDSLGTLDE